MHGALADAKIIIFEVNPIAEDDWSSLGPRSTTRCVAEALTSANASQFAEVEVVSTFLASKLDASVISQLPRLRLIATRSTGYDHIDLQACVVAGVSVCNVPAYGDPTVAEFVFALTLALSRKVVRASARTRRDDFSQTDLRGFDLAGKTMGVVGVGRIGQRVIQIAKGFGMTVLGYDVAPDRDLETKLAFRYTELGDLLATCDVLTLHVPGGERNLDLISTAELARMKPTALLINTSRGDVVNTEALVLALSQARLAGAGLDVFAEEGLLRDEVGIFQPGEKPSLKSLRGLAANHALLTSPNVVATAHIAYDTQEAVGRIVSVTQRNIEAFLSGKPEHLVSPPLNIEPAPSPGETSISGGYELVMAPLSDAIVRCRRDFLANPGPEQVHALRGALRRARAGLLIFKDISASGECAWIRHELERMIKQLGSLRDLDVLRVQYDLDLIAPSGVFPTGFDDLLNAARQAAVEDATNHVKSPRTAFLLDGFPDWLASQSTGLPGRDLRAHLVQWLNVADANVRAQGDEDLQRGQSARHRLREQIKVLKYDFEVFQRLYKPNGAGPYLLALETLHTLLGDLNDHAIGAKLRQSLVSPDRRPKDVGRPTKARREALARAWAQFNGLPRSWALAPANQAGPVNHAA